MSHRSRGISPIASTIARDFARSVAALAQKLPVLCRIVHAAGEATTKSNNGDGRARRLELLVLLEGEQCESLWRECADAIQEIGHDVMISSSDGGTSAVVT